MFLFYLSIAITRGSPAQRGHEQVGARAAANLLPHGDEVDPNNGRHLVLGVLPALIMASAFSIRPRKSSHNPRHRNLACEWSCR